MDADITNEVMTQKKDCRLANFELLRIVAMLLVMTVHANFTTFGAPDFDSLRSNPVSTFLRYLGESLSMVGVDVFVLISGWFGIKLTMNKLGNLIFQVFFFSFGFFLAYLFINPNEALSLSGLKSIFLFQGKDYWFIKAYTILLLLSPFLNSFIQDVHQKGFASVLSCYLLFMFIYGWMEPESIHFTMNGTSALSFVGLYLIGRYASKYRGLWINLNKYYDLLIYFGLSILLAVICYFLLGRGIRTTLDSRLLNYGNPLIILSSLYLLLFFSKLSFSCKLINWVASSCLAAYLLHCNFFFFGQYTSTIKICIQNYEFGWILAFLFIILLFTFSVFIDKLRICIWKKIQECFSFCSKL